jgi:hypothetical protein
MPEIAVSAGQSRTLAALDCTALGAVLVLPLLLLHAHGIAEVAIAIADLCFLARSALIRDWIWASRPWLLIGWTWWAWLVFCSLPIPALHLGEGGTRSLVQAIVFVRFFVFAAALEHTILRTARTRRWLYWLIAASAAYIAVGVIFQLFTGYGFWGDPIADEGVLTGPFRGPRAGTPYVLMLFPAIIPWAAVLLTRSGIRSLIGTWLLLIGGVAIALLIGQRMPFLLTLLGLAVIGLLLPRLRWGVLAAAAVAGVLLVASPDVAPSAHFRLVEKFSRQMEHFAVSPYGELYTRAFEIGVQNPITGLGAEGMRTGCANPRYFRPSFDGSLPDGGGASFCWVHPHSYYFEALVNGGFPGLILFCAEALAWLLTLGRGLWRQPEPLRVALFAAALMELWPIASSTSFTSMPVAGWAFLLLGWGLAEARWLNRQSDPI